MTEPHILPTPRASRLTHFPVSFFAVVMGLAGLTIATERAASLWHWPVNPAPTLLLLSGGTYLLILLTYLLKWLRYPQAAAQEFAHPVRLSFFPTISIGLILLSIASLPLAPGVARPLWDIGTALQLLLALVILSHWMHREHFQVPHAGPAWFIPIVGNILIPIAGVPLGYPDVSWFAFSVGLVLWLPMLSIVLNRLFFHPPIPGKLLPTLFILIAPPAVGFLSWTRLHGGQLDDVGRILFFFALFTTALLFVQSGYFRKLAFGLPWWAYSFPLAAMTLATLLMWEKTGLAFYAGLVALLYAFLVGLIVLLTVKTLRAMSRGEICVPE